MNPISKPPGCPAELFPGSDAIAPGKANSLRILRNARALLQTDWPFRAVLNVFCCVCLPPIEIKVIHDVPVRKPSNSCLFTFPWVPRFHAQAHPFQTAFPILLRISAFIARHHKRVNNELNICNQKSYILRVANKALSGTRAVERVSTPVSPPVSPPVSRHDYWPVRHALRHVFGRVVLPLKYLSFL